MRVAEEGEARALLLRGVDQPVGLVGAHGIEVPVGEKGLHRAEPDGQAVRGERRIVAVAADGIERRLRESLPQEPGVPVMIAEVDVHVGLCRPRRLQHGKGVAVGVRKNCRADHGHASIHHFSRSRI